VAAITVALKNLGILELLQHPMHGGLGQSRLVDDGLQGKGRISLGDNFKQSKES
jgi:hypothetical protein